jgi:hypothetical protein
LRYVVFGAGACWGAVVFTAGAAGLPHWAWGRGFTGAEGALFLAERPSSSFVFEGSRVGGFDGSCAKGLASAGVKQNVSRNRPMNTADGIAMELAMVPFSPRFNLIATLTMLSRAPIKVPLLKRISVVFVIS